MTITKATIVDRLRQIRIYIEDTGEVGNETAKYIHWLIKIERALLKEK